MAGAIRNSCVVRGTLAANQFQWVYHVPAGYVLLLKNVVLRPLAATQSTIIVYISDSAGTAPCTIYQANIDSTQANAWNGWVALNATDMLAIQTQAVALNYWVSGALLPFSPGL